MPSLITKNNHTFHFSLTNSKELVEKEKKYLTSKDRIQNSKLV